MNIKRCPKCKGRVKFKPLVMKYFCWECEIYYRLHELMLSDKK